MTVFAVFEKSMEMSNRPEFLDRAWLSAELAALAGQGKWAELGATAVHAALAAAPFGGNLFNQISTLAMVEVPDAAWGDPAWVSGELGRRIAALAAAGSNLQETGRALAAGAARVEVQ